MPRHPLPLGAGVETVPPTPTPTPAPPFWTPLVPAAMSWNLSRGASMPRFEHIFPQESGADQQWVKVEDPD